MNAKHKIWLNGKLIDWDKAQVHVISHSLHYGTSVFEGIRCYGTENGPAVFRLTEHIERLHYSAGCIGMKIPFSPKDVIKGIFDLIKSGSGGDCYIRPIVFRGSNRMGLSAKVDNVSLAIAEWPWTLKKGASDGIRVNISSFVRPHPKSIIIDAKIGGYYANSVLAAQEAQKKGFDEALLLDHRGYVAEGPGENIFIVKDGKLFTPSEGSILPGITRNSIIKIARDNDIKVVERSILPEELSRADELFFVGTAVELWPILKVDGRLVKKGRVGPVTDRLRIKFQDIVRGKNKKYNSWLSFVK